MNKPATRTLHATVAWVWVPTNNLSEALGFGEYEE